MIEDPIPTIKRQLADAVLDRFSVERLIRMLAQVDRRVDVAVVNTGPAQLRWFRILRERRERQLGT